MRVGLPERYLGTNIEKIQLEDGHAVWSMICVDYLIGTIQNLDKLFKEDMSILKYFGDDRSPCTSSYRSEIDVIPELDDRLTNRYQQLIGMLR